MAQRKLLPALYQLKRMGYLPEQTKIVGISRREVDSTTVFQNLEQYTDEPFDSATAQTLIEMTNMFQMDLDNKESYARLYERIEQLDKSEDPAVRLYYLSIPPAVFQPLVKLLGETGHNSSPYGKDLARLLVEKPFGFDIESAKELINTADTYFDETQIYRIDHYVAKETVQNILTFRFENPLFEAVWDKDHIDHITVLAHEKLGIEGRVAFYEQTGAVRDLIQSHLLQLLAITTMVKPERLDSADIHEEKLRLLKAITPISSDTASTKAVRGQYDGYRGEVNNPDSHVETFAQLQIEINNEQWRGVPIIIETGKALAEKTTEITVCFAQPITESHEHNRLVFRIQPNEGITMLLQVKRPGVENRTETAEMDFTYEAAFNERHADAYERVLVDAFRGDHTLFATADEVLASWEIIEGVVQRWTHSSDDLLVYEQGSSGPDISLNPHHHKKT